MSIDNRKGELEMKEASGELNMTLVTIIAIAAIAGLFFALKDPIMKAINGKWGDINNTNPNGTVGK